MEIPEELQRDAPRKKTTARKKPNTASPAAAATASPADAKSSTPPGSNKTVYSAEPITEHRPVRPTPKAKLLPKIRAKMLLRGLGIHRPNHMKKYTTAASVHTGTMRSLSR